MGFEPTVLVRGRQFSRLVHSTALPPLRGCGLRAQATAKPDSGPEQGIQFRVQLARNPWLRHGSGAVDFGVGRLAGAIAGHVHVARARPGPRSIGRRPRRIASARWYPLVLYRSSRHGLRSGARAAPAGMPVRDMPASPLRQIAGGFLCNAFNPKAPIYFLALFTVVLSPGLPLPTLLVYGAWIMLLQWAWFSLVATLFAAATLSRARTSAPPWWRSVCACWQLRAIERDCAVGRQWTNRLTTLSCVSRPQTRATNRAQTTCKTSRAEIL